MGLLTNNGPPEWHPASQQLKVSEHLILMKTIVRMQCNQQYNQLLCCCLQSKKRFHLFFYIVIKNHVSLYEKTSRNDRLHLWNIIQNGFGIEIILESQHLNSQNQLYIFSAADFGLQGP